MRTLGLVPARTGSKGVPGKNFRDFCGKPLWKWAYEVAREACTTAVLSSDEGIGEIKRPAFLAQDDTPMLPVVQHALERYPDHDAVVLLQPTQPLRQRRHVAQAIQLLEETGADSVVSVVRIPAHYCPEFAFRVRAGRLHPFLGDVPGRRQDIPPAYSRDGTVYVTRADVVRAGSLYGADCCPLIIPSHESCNIDTEDDWDRAEQMMRERDAIRRAG